MWTSTVQTTCHRMFMVYFTDKKSTIGVCFVSCKKNIVVTRGLLFSFHESTVEMYGDTLREFLCSLEHCIYGS